MRLLEWLKLEGRTQAWVADLVGTSPSVINDWAHQRKIPNLDNRRLIAAVSRGLVGVDEWEKKAS